MTRGPRRASGGRHVPRESVEALEASPSLSVEDALASPDALVRALAWLDRRAGKRRLRGRLARGTDGLPPLEARGLRLRCEAEVIR